MTTHISLMLAVEDASEAADWYKRALGATELWSLGSVLGLRIEEAPIFLHQPTDTGFVSPAASGNTTVRVEVFCDDPDTFIRRAVGAGADGSVDEIRDHQTPWGVHRQGGFRDPFGHVWLVGDKSPLGPFPSSEVTESDLTPVAAPPSPRRPVRGSCLCGGVRFEITQPFRRANHCHCSRCRKHSGTFGETQGRVPRDGFRLLQGEELIRSFRPVEGAVKAFCSVCGSSLFGGTWPDCGEVSVRLGALDDDPGIRAQYHSFVASRAPWDDVPDDGLPRYEAANPEADPSPSATPL
jgi:PhnB protein